MRIRLLIIVLILVMFSMLCCTSKEFDHATELSTSSQESSLTEEFDNPTEASTSSQESSLTQEYTSDDDGNPYKYLSSIDELFEQGKNYEIYTDKSQINYHYYVMDNDGNTIDEGYHGWRGSFGFTEKDGILELDYGLGGPLWERRYYDVSNGRVSRFFSKPLQTSGELVAYFKRGENLNKILVIQNMFDPSKYYKEINRDFSILVMTGQGTAEFLNDNKQLKITYWINPDDKEITEIIDLD